MKIQQFVFRDRDFSYINMPGLDYRVKSYTWNVIGGPKRAVVEATGEINSLFRLIEHLRAPVEIYNKKGWRRWWGIIDEVVISYKAVQVGVSLDKMSNKCAIAYTESNERKTTAWEDDDDSLADYGIKEILLSRSEITGSDALQLRDTVLASTKYPVPVIRFSGRRQAAKATIYCSSWLDTLDWRYYESLLGKESYETLGQGGREIGEDDRPMAAMSFQISSAAAWDATSVWLRTFKYPAASVMADNFVVGLYSSTGIGGSPNALLSSGSIAGNSIPDYETWTQFVMAAAVTLNPATEYWIRASRSGAVDATKYYMIGTNTDDGYQKGRIKLYNTNLAAWVAENKGDVNFIVEGDLATTAQVSNIITGVGEFFTATDIENASGVNTNPYRSGDTTALFELLNLLKTGTTADRRLLCEVTPTRRLRVFVEPSKPASVSGAYTLDGDHRLRQPGGPEVTGDECKVGIWAKLQDVIPTSVDLSKLADTSAVFIEEAEYDAERDEYHVLRAKDQANIYDLAGMSVG